MIVAVAILAMSLGALYQAAGGATRSIGVDEKMTYAVELARSLRDNHAVVPISGINEKGETSGGFVWRVEAQPLAIGDGAAVSEGTLQQLHVEVTWPDGQTTRRFALDGVAVGREEVDR
jgi:general secretion pathway protein I